jgi:hypothetical protein
MDDFREYHNEPFVSPVNWDTEARGALILGDYTVYFKANSHGTERALGPRLFIIFLRSQSDGYLSIVIARQYCAPCSIKIV